MMFIDGMKNYKCTNKIWHSWSKNMNSPFYWVHRMLLISSRLSATLLWPAAINFSISVSHLHPTGGVNERGSLLCVRGCSLGLHLCWSGSKQSQTALSSFWQQWYDDSVMSGSVKSMFGSQLHVPPLCLTGVDFKEAIFSHRLFLSSWDPSKCWNADWKLFPHQIWMICHINRSAAVWFRS